jgi:hypothetical protein
MKMYRSFNSIILAVAIFVLTGSAYAEMTISEIASKYSASVVTIVALDKNDQPLSLGSGFFIDGNGGIATNYHVLVGASKAILKTSKGEKGEVLEISGSDPNLDLIMVTSSLQNTTPLPIGDSDTVVVGEDIVVIGNPAGLEGTVSKGIISGVRKAEGVKLIQITAPISPGSSGGPVFNLLGKVVGLATAYLYTGQNLNFATPINYLKDLKPATIKFGSIPPPPIKSPGANKEGKTLVQVFNVHSRSEIFFMGSSLCYATTGCDFALRNQSNYPVSNIDLFFIYRDYNDEIVSYSAMRCKGPILPKLALQFYHSHHVNHWGSKTKSGTIEVRILDYQIDRLGSSSPSDLLLE